MVYYANFCRSRNRTIMASMDHEKPIYYKVLDTSRNRKNFAEYIHNIIKYNQNIIKYYQIIIKYYQI